MNEWPYVPCSCGFHHVSRALAIFEVDGEIKRPWAPWCYSVVMYARANRKENRSAET